MTSSGGGRRGKRHHWKEASARQGAVMQDSGSWKCPLRCLPRLRSGRTAKRLSGCYGNQKRAAVLNCRDCATFAGGRAGSRTRTRPGG